jgi:outer membrane lipase/esterase
MTSSRKPLRSLLAAALALAAAPVFAQSAPFTQTVFFGDSLTDSGHFQQTLVQIPGIGANGMLIGKFTTNPGYVWSEYLAAYYGTNAVTDNQGGSNYAVGGAWVGTETVGGVGPQPSLVSQMTSYLTANGGHADANALYTVWGGANDLFSITDPATAPAVVGSAVTSEIGIVGALQAAGAQYVMVATVPDLGLTPAYSGNPLTAGLGNQLSTGYNAALFGGLASAGLHVIPLDTFHLLQEIVSNPGAYGFGNATDPACSPLGPGGGSSLFCNPATLVNPGAAESYVFADSVHPTTTAHAVVAQYAVSMIEAPRQMAVLPHAEATIGRARAERVGAQLSQRPEADGMRWWADVRGDSQRYGEDASNYDGGGPTLMVGVDWASGNIVYGAFGGYGRQGMDWGQRRGSFDQTDASLGGFAGWYGERAWVNGQVSYSWLGFDTDRDVQLGQATRTHHGSADGSNLSVGVNGGWNFGDGAFRHGPVVSLLSQQIDVDGFAESDPTLSTSLAYADQSVDSLIGSAGWQFSYAPSDRIHPYARVTWDHEFEDPATQAFATAQSIPGSLEYAVPGQDFDRDYGTLLLGARTQLLGLDANVGASATFAQEGGNDASVFVTIGSRF